MMLAGVVTASDRRVLKAFSLLSLVALLPGCRATTPRPMSTLEEPVSTLIRGATVYDGSGAAGRTADVRFQGERIVAIGELPARPDEVLVDGHALVLAPGFIDTHSHADTDILERPEARAAVSQGITTVVVGADGGSRYPLSDFFARLRAAPPAVNLASWGGHNTYREHVMGADFRRPATDRELERMRRLLQKDLEAGALGLSTGLEYDPGIYSDTREVLALAHVAAAHGGRYSSHIRSEDRKFWEAVEEVLTIGRETSMPVNITHIKLAMRSTHGRAEELVTMLDAARAEGVEVTADIYPYTYWQSTLEVLFPERDFDNPAAARFAVTEISTPTGLLLAHFEPDPALQGKTLAAIAAQRNEDPVHTLSALIREAQAYRTATGEQEVESVIGVSMDEADIERLIRWPYINVCTDGELSGSHPRGFGSFTRVLGRLVRERQVLGWAEAIHKMTGRAAATVGFEQRGLVQPGKQADLVLFDAETIIDRATIDEPHADSEGIVKVWVNGRLVWDRGETTGQRPGQVLRRGS